jgi:hypothetical protein
MDADKSYPINECDYIKPIHPPLAPPHQQSLEAISNNKNSNINET